MFSAADIIEALGLRRRLKSIRPQAPGTFPPGWQQWFDTMQATPHAVKGAAPQTIVDEFVLRELRTPPARDAQLNRWQAFATLWRQNWHPPIPEERRLRWFAATVSGLLHLCFAVLLVFLAYVYVPPPQPAGDEQVVQAEFIGTGTPEETGGGAPQGPQPEPQETAAAPSPPAATPTPVEQPPKEPPPPQPAEPAPQPEQPVAEQPPPQAEPEPTPVVEVPPAPQPLQVTETTQPTTTFVLPPPRPREVVVAPSELAVPTLRQPTQSIARVQAQRETIEQQRVEVQRIKVAPQVRGEESARLTQQIAITTAPTQSREIAMPTLRGETRAIPMPSRGTTPGATTPGTSTANAPSTTPGSSSAPSAAAPGGQQAPGSGTTPSSQAGTGTTPNAPPGAWPSPNRGDDWGLGTRNKPGGKPGVLDAQGRPILGEPPTPGKNAPGTVEAHIADLDKAGRWLKRPPLDYEPTSFDQYWIPDGTLLEEWVRKGIKALTIPIPGTDKKISCVVSILQFGGGCGLVDPNKNAQAARARPPPDIPFKPHLQEDNGSIRTPPPAPSTRVPPAPTP